MNSPLMPKSTAVWLIENTSLTFEQISKFCKMHILEIQGIADGEVAVGIQGKNPVLSGELTKEEINRCESDPSTYLTIIKDEIPLSSKLNKNKARFRVRATYGRTKRRPWSGCDSAPFGELGNPRPSFRYARPGSFALRAH